MTAAARQPAAGTLRELVPLLGPLAAIESVRTAPVAPVRFAHAKLVHVMAGSTRIRSAAGERVLTAGDVLVLGAHMRCEATPQPLVRAWTIYLDEDFLRGYMRWALPGPEHVVPGLHPSDWNGHALVFHPGVDRLALLEPLLRRMSVIPHRGRPASVAELMALFAQTAEHIVPTLVTTLDGPTPVADAPVGRLTGAVAVPEAARAAALLRGHLSHPWQVGELARMVALSRSQLTFRFTQGFGMNRTGFCSDRYVSASAASRV